MDHGKFIDVVRQFPQVWDRNNPSFREKELKKACWDQIGVAMGKTGTLCRDTFKSLREKYIREREKQSIFGEKYLPWQHLENMKFLDPHIVLRKQSLNYEEDLQMAEEYKCVFNNNSSSSSINGGGSGHHNSNNNNNNINNNNNNNSNNGGDTFLQNALNEINHADFDRSLIGLVKKASPIWDRKSNSYPSKQLKYQLWRTIAQTLKKDVNICMLRWKGLREKYIRQKSKYHEGEGKWEFLDEMSFLDKVIQYRRKQCDNNNTSTSSSTIDYLQQQSYTSYPLNCELIDDDNTDSSNDFNNKIKTENSNNNNGGEYYDNVDSSYDSATSSAPGIGRKRSASDYSESSMCGGLINNNKRDRIDPILMQQQQQQQLQQPPQDKSPEQMFGDLVAAMLAKKTERDKNIAMIEIMKILTKE